MTTEFNAQSLAAQFDGLTPEQLAEFVGALSGSGLSALSYAARKREGCIIYFDRNEVEWLLVNQIDPDELDEVKHTGDFRRVVDDAIYELDIDHLQDYVNETINDALNRLAYEAGFPMA